MQKAAVVVQTSTLGSSSLHAMDLAKNFHDIMSSNAVPNHKAHSKTQLSKKLRNGSLE